MRTSGRKEVTTAGVAERLADSARGRDQLVLVGIAENVGPVFVGTESVLAATGLEQGIPINPGEVLKLADVDPYDIWIDARNAGDGVTWW